MLPPITLLHGSADATCPHDQSEAFYAALLAAGVPEDRVALKIYDGKTHTSPILEDPISGSDPLVGDLLDVVRSVLKVVVGRVRRGQLLIIKRVAQPTRTVWG